MQQTQGILFPCSYLVYLERKTVNPNKVRILCIFRPYDFGNKGFKYLKDQPSIKGLCNDVCIEFGRV